MKVARIARYLALVAILFLAMSKVANAAPQPASKAPGQPTPLPALALLSPAPAACMATEGLAKAPAELLLPSAPVPLSCPNPTCQNYCQVRCEPYGCIGRCLGNCSCICYC
jgi:hypothetical protein